VKAFAEKLREQRIKKGMSLRALAKATGFHISAISRWENDVNSIGIEGLITFAKFFGVSTDYLLGLEN